MFKGKGILLLRGTLLTRVTYHYGLSRGKDAWEGYVEGEFRLIDHKIFHYPLGLKCFGRGTFDIDVTTYADTIATFRSRMAAFCSDDLSAFEQQERKTA